MMPGPPPSIPTYSSSAPPPPVIPPSPPEPAEFDCHKSRTWPFIKRLRKPYQGNGTGGEECERLRKSSPRLGESIWRERAEETREGKEGREKAGHSAERLRLEKERMERQERLLKGILELPVCNAARQSTTSLKGSIPSLSPSPPLASSPSNTEA
ncbi:unnamed protein product [Tuber melanosporum]|uniref:(Perigord truffle) hypothetical protein n=1 Tax=Tuber melanosporum (strain Mel28) TaxID=656061 RepID=D5GQ19_TUBMM|nr:uncharacterized protein GSTUM_00012152001 [Tuber melanosporum]CAZ86612.1 unnamed protein product [Tuber melanosporum]